jgi:hypothetical protein
MDKLKNFVETNRDVFDDDFPPEGHVERFEKKLSKKKRRHRIAFAAVAMAAAVALLLLPRPPALYVCESGEEIEELRFYYNMQLYDVETQIEDLYAQRKTSGSLGLMQETERVMQKIYDFEAEILPTLPCSETGLSVVNGLYSNSLECLNFMLEQMQRMTDGYTN